MAACGEAAEDPFTISAHEASEGPALQTSQAEHEALVFEGGACPEGVVVRSYDVVAIPVVMVLNRWGDRDPDAFMFALREDIPAIRAQEAAAEEEGFGLTSGVAADPIQPLTLRANAGDCMRIAFSNELQEPVSFHVHGADLLLASSGDPALSTNPNSVAGPGDGVDYEWFVDATYYAENTHAIHAHGPKARFYVSHGLFGTVVVEPPGSEYLDSRTAEPLCAPANEGVVECRSSWDAMISPGDGSADFREFVMVYHEIGNAQFTPVDTTGEPNPIIDPITQSYKPNGRAINYRSESFWRRLGSLEGRVGFYDDWQPDEAEAYSSYVFGEPSMPIPQSYVGDPTKFRLVHGGSETFHVPHLHGGGIQWQRQPKVGVDQPDYTPIDAGLKKDFPSRMPSSGNDSQTIGPSETYELEIGCGSGGCQQAVGDHLFHCHVASHYISGMWHFWRIYNTLQDGLGKTDALALVAELPDRAGGQERARPSDELVGQTIHFAGETVVLTPAHLDTLLARQLPPPGVPRDPQDASVWNWVVEGDRLLGEPETALVWPNYRSATPGERPPLLFQPASGKLAFPFLRPHLGQRPPFAPAHGPAPYLEPRGAPRASPAEPGTNGDESLCPSGTPRRSYKIHAISTDIPVTQSITDDDGMIFVLKENEAAARADPDYKVPLAIRAEPARPDLMKTNIHIHFVQFDVQASDGVIAGANFEQAVRPYDAPGVSSRLTQPAPAGTTMLHVEDATRFQPGVTIAVAVDQDLDVFETAEVRRALGDDLVLLAEPLERAHAAGETISLEFVRYRWYVARQNGAIYFHDHVDALGRWGHGLFGALIAEPTGSSYHDPRAGSEIASGPIADIHNKGEVVPGLTGSFREYVLFLNDRNPLTGSAINLRAEPLHAETARGSGPPDLALSSVRHGDPATPVLSAYVGDPIMFRLLTSATEEVHPFHITGHHFRQERFQANSPPLTVFGVGISERFNAYVEAAGGAAGMPGDYLYYNGADRHFREGSWGILRVHDASQGDLRPLPGREPPPSGTGFPRLTFTGGNPPRASSPGDVCPQGATARSYDVSAISLPLTFNAAAGVTIPSGRLYVLSEDIEDVRSGVRDPEPLVIRANAGECLTVTFHNAMADQPASFHLDSPALDPRGSLGITLGFDPDQAAQTGETVTHRYYLASELGTVLLRDFGNPFRNGREGLYGALIVEPAGASYLDPYSGEPLRSGAAAVIELPGAPDFREFVTVLQDNDPDIGLFLMPYDQEVNRVVGVNYRAEPLSLRLGALGVLLDADTIPDDALEDAAALFDSERFGDPATPVFEAFAGDPVRFRVVSGFSEQNQVFAIEGHEWQLTPQIPGSDVVSARYLPPTGVLNIELQRTGGPKERPGDYLWLNHRLPYMKAGQWGILRLHPAAAAEVDLLPLEDR